MAASKMIYVSSAHQATNTADIDSASSLYHDYVSLHFYQKGRNGGAAGAANRRRPSERPVGPAGRLSPRGLGAGRGTDGRRTARRLSAAWAGCGLAAIARVAARSRLC